MFLISDGRVIIDVEVNKSGADRELDKLKGSFDGLGESQIKQTREQYRNEQSSKNAATGLGRMSLALGLANIGAKLVTAGFRVVKQSVGSAIDRFDTMEAFPRVMAQLGYDTDDSAAAMEKLNQGVQGLPTPLQDVVETAQKLAFMTGDLDGATDTTLALNNAFLASGSSTMDAKRGAQQYIQMLSSGKVDITSWKTLQETMLPALNQTAEAFGFTGEALDQQLYAALQNGEITFKEFNDMLIKTSTASGGLSEQALEMAKGIRTSMENIKTAVVGGIGDVIEALNDSMIAAGLGSIQENLEKVKVKVQETFKAFVKNIPPAIKKMREVYDTLEPWLPLIGYIVGAIVGMFVVVDVINGISKAFKKVSSAIDAVGGLMKMGPWGWFAVALVAIAAALIYAYNHSEEFREIVDKAFKVVKKVIKNVLEWIAENVPAAFKKMGEDIAFMEQMFNDIWDAIKGAAEYVWTSIRDAWNRDVQFIKDDFNAFTTFFSELWASIKETSLELWQNVKTAWSNDIQDIKDGWSAFKQFFSDLWTSIKETAIQVWETVKTAWADDVQSLKDTWDTIKEFFSTLWEWIKTTAATGWEAIKQTVLDIVEPFIEKAKEIFDYFSEDLALIWENIKTIAEAAWELIKTTVLAPVLILIDLLTGDFEGLRDDLDMIWENIKEHAETIWTAWTESIMIIVDAFLVLLSGAWDELTTLAAETWDKLKTAAEEDWEEIKTAIVDIATDLKDDAVEQFNELKTLVTEANKTLKAAAEKDWKELETAVKNAAKTLREKAVADWQELEKGVTTAARTLRTAATNDWNELKTSVTTAARTLRTAAVNDWNELKNGVTGAARTLRTEASSQWNELKTSVINAAATLKSEAIRQWNELKDTVSRLAQAAKDGAIRAWNTLKTETSKAFNKVKDFIEDPLKKINLKQIGKDIVSGLIGGISSMFGRVKTAVGELATTIKDKIRGALDTRSPSRWMNKQIGRMIPRGIAEGIEHDEDIAAKAMESAAKGIKLAAIKPEIALGIGGKMSTSRASVAKKAVAGSTVNTSSTNETMIGLLQQLVDKNQVLVMDSGTLVGEIGDKMNQYLGNDASMKARYR